ncbi:hypothetical protein Mycsm_00119 [Mycobacterium sp. JS623]|uniref:Rv1733c family protein n=1 Tax=Mycobacterium sp. JS623 TaxID=212767 RepID=UPI0002A58DC1|nr:hypothetical protein [Mycobacterium sp. JS623]AGB20580.1 hypothetical protein Mycsm_00119 [Mycobacterium sp. JS623]
MRKFVLRCRYRWVARAFGRNPLLRWPDRVEACVILAAMVLALGVGGVSVAQGAVVYQSHARLYAAQARMRHMVTATVAATANPHQQHTATSTVLATWPSAVDGARGGESQSERAEWVTTRRSVGDGDRIRLWLNDDGRQVDPPTPVMQADVDAIGVGAGIWGAAIVGLMAGVAVVRSPLDRIRRAQLDREIEHFVNGDATNHPQ